MKLHGNGAREERMKDEGRKNEGGRMKAEGRRCGCEVGTFILHPSAFIL
jgi:hypothetical protein